MKTLIVYAKKGWAFLSITFTLILLSVGLVLMPPYMAGAFITGAATVFAILINKRLEQQATLKQQQRQQQMPVYEEFLDMIFRIFSQDKVGSKPMTEQELARTMYNWLSKMMLHASPEVISAYANFFRLANRPSQDPTAGLNSVGAVLLAIRKDMGYQDKLEDLYATFITDADSFFKPIPVAETPRVPATIR